MSTFSATARVRVTIEIDAGSSWGPGCTVEQIRKQAAEEAILRLSATLNPTRTHCKIIGQPKVITVMHGETQAMRESAE